MIKAMSTGYVHETYNKSRGFRYLSVFLYPLILFNHICLIAICLAATVINLCIIKAGLSLILPIYF